MFSLQSFYCNIEQEKLLQEPQINLGVVLFKVFTMIPRIVFIGTPEFAGELLRYIVTAKLADVVGVWSKPDRISGRGLKRVSTGVSHVANSMNIPLFNYEKINCDESISQLKKLSPDLALIVAHGEIIKPSYYEIPKYGTFNLHFSLLPAYRGASPLQSAILDGLIETGMTIQKINQKLDEGEIALSTKYSIQSMTSEEAFVKSTDEAKKLFHSFFEKAPSTFVSLTPQTVENLSYCKKIKKEDGVVHTYENGKLTYRKYLAFTPWPGLYFFAEGIRYNINKMVPIEKTSADFEKVSTFLDLITTPFPYLAKLEKKRLLLVFADLVFEILNIKQENKKELDSLSFLNGTKLSFPCKIDNDL